MSDNLVIVESPAKAKTIEKYLGKDYTVTSCYGHIRDLPKSSDAIDVDQNYTPKYVVPKEKKEVVGKLKKLSKSAKQVWLATDEDREGEAISWHLCEVLGLNPSETKRIVFHEITKPAIQKAISNPRYVNQNLVNAQQARRVLDRLVGFEVSPVLWRKISRSGSLSAGRVQSVAVRLIVERDRSIEAFESKAQFKVTALFHVKDENGKNVILKAELPKKFETEADAQSFTDKCNGATFTIGDIQVKPAKRKPTAPFTTSTLQQQASSKLGFSVSRTMRVAQKLYEAGKITYMRTDSTFLSETARANAKATILQDYGNEYHEERIFKTKSAGAQEAHEAIRPTYFENREASNDRDEQRLYELIWKRSIASQMSEARLERTTVGIEIDTTSERLVAKGEVLKFDGFLKVYREAALDEDQGEDDNSGILPPLSVGQVLDLHLLTARERFDRPPARFNEATLVKKLEELGIGRPSTYAPTISTIQKREYAVKESREGYMRDYVEISLEGPKGGPLKEVKREVKQERTGVEKNKLFPTDTGIVVNDFLVKYFQNILDYNFTAQIEKQFDEIADGNMEWSSMIDDFYKPFHETVEDTLENAERSSGERELGVDPKSGKIVICRLGRYGPMVQIGKPDPNDKEAEKPKFAKIRPPYTLQNITLEQALEFFKLPRVLGELEGQPVKANEGRFGPYVQLGKLFASIPAEQDVMTISYDDAVVLIKAKKEAEAKKMIKDFGEEAGIQILNGRWGPYIKAGKKNVKIPKDKVPAELTLEECQELVAKAPEKKGRARKKK